MPNPFLFKCTLLIAALLVFASAAEQTTQKQQPETLPTLAVHNLEGHGLTESEAMTLSDVLRSRLMETKKYKVMERSEMETILNEQAFQQSGACTEEACIVEMGQLLGIEQILAGSIGKVGKAFSINVRIISVKSGEIIKSVSHNYTGPIENLLTSEITVVAKKIAGIETVVTPRAENEQPVKKKGGNKLRRRIVVGTLAAAVVGGGAAAYFMMQNNEKKETPTSEVEVQWEF
jgi:curli biogenesis system outer membrane secretion channel CsgG